MSVIEKILLIRSMNVIEDTMIDYDQRERNALMTDTVGRVDVTDLTSEQAVELGFGRWDEETNLHLIPFYLYDYLEYGQTLTSISGEVKMVAPGYDKDGSGYIDNDHRFGCLAYGFIPKEA